MQTYLIENVDRSIYLVTDTCEALENVANEYPEETWIIRPINMKISNIDKFRTEYIQSEVEKIEPCVVNVLRNKHHIVHSPADLVHSIAESAYSKSKDGVDISCAIDETIEDDERIAKAKSVLDKIVIRKNS